MARRVLITGGAGFIGSRLAERFHAAGDDVVVLDSLLSQVHGPDPDSTSPLLARARTVAEVRVGSVTSSEDLRSALRGVTHIVHLAAETGTGQSMYEIDRYVDANVGGTAKLLDLLVNEPHEVKRIIVASSRAIYGEGAYRTEDGRVVYPPHRRDEDMAAGDFEVHMPGEGPLAVTPTTEDAALHPSSVYGITKQMQESLVMTVAPTCGVEAVSLRYQNVFGPGQSLTNPYTGILSIFSTLIKQDKEINIFEDGQESRDFVYVDDVVEATYLAAVHPAAAGRVYNVGSGHATTVQDVVDALADAFGKNVRRRVSGNYRNGDIRHNVADTSRIERELGFAARTPFAEGLRAFTEWVNSTSASNDAYERSLAEMAERRLLK